MHHDEDAMLAKIRADIARVGWHVVLVPPDAQTAGWAHSIGLVERFGHPELVVFGADLERIGPLLNAVAARVAAGRRLEAGTQLSGVLRDLPLAVREVAPRWIQSFLGNAAWYAGRPDLPALQIFWPDPAGRFPWDPDCDPTWREDQPQLAHARVHEALSERWIEALRREEAL